MNKNDKSLKFTVKPSIWFLIVSVEMYAIGITVSCLAYSLYLLILYAAVGTYLLLVFINVRIYAYKYYFVKRNILRQSKEYSWQDVKLLYRGVTKERIVRYDIVDNNEKKVFVTLEDTFSNTDALKKAVLRKKASSKGVPQHRRFWE